MRVSCLLLLAFAACSSPSPTVTPVSPASPTGNDDLATAMDMAMPANPPPAPVDMATTTPPREPPPNGTTLDMAVFASDLAMTPRDLATPPPGADLATPPDLANPAGPWPVTDITYYNFGDEILDSSSDDAHNIWAASPNALYLLRPGATAPQKFTAADGLHIQSFIEPWGSPGVTHITAIAGARANEVYVGYHGYESEGDRYLDTEAQKALGQADRVVVGADGKLSIVRYQFRCPSGGANCWENRSARRMMVAHSGAAAGHAFIAFDHGVSHVFNDQIGDHIHVEIYYVQDGGTKGLKLGEQYGLYALPDGQLWTASGYGVGLQGWYPTASLQWVQMPWTEAFTVYSSDHDLDVPAGYREDNRAVGVGPDGTVWFAGLRGLASWLPAHHNYTGTKIWNSTAWQDMVVDLDGTLWLVRIDGALIRFNPATGAMSTWSGIDGARRIVMDTTVTPRALHVSMDRGLAVIRAR